MGSLWWLMLGVLMLVYSGWAVDVTKFRTVKVIIRLFTEVSQLNTNFMADPKLKLGRGYILVILTVG